MNVRAPSQAELDRLAEPGVKFRRMPIMRGFNKFPIESRKDNIRHAFSLGLPNLYELIDKEAGRDAVIVGGGPSVDQYVFQIRRCQAEGARVIAIERMLSWCVRYGIYPEYVAVMDASDDVVEAFQDICSGPTYLIATQCQPAVFDKLRGCRCYIYSTPHAGLDDFWEYGAGRNDCEINSAGSVVLCAMSLAMTLGMADLHVFGFDCHITNGGYANGIVGRGLQSDFIKLRIEGRDFESTYPYLLFAQQFFILKKFGEDTGLLKSVKVYGNSLVNAMSREDLRG